MWGEDSRGIVVDGGREGVIGKSGGWRRIDAVRWWYCCKGLEDSRWDLSAWGRDCRCSPVAA